MAQGALPGFRDFYPEQFAERAHIMAAWREVARRFAFVEYDGPPLEPLELYTKKSGDEIVGQLYNFTDKGGREVALRPEMTPTLARMVAATRERAAEAGSLVLHAAAVSLRAAAAGPACASTSSSTSTSSARPTSRPTRSCWRVAIEIMRALGLTSCDVRRARLRPPAAARDPACARRRRRAVPAAVFGVIDKLDRQPRECSREKLARARRVRRRRSTRCSTLIGDVDARRHRAQVREAPRA